MTNVTSIQPRVEPTLVDAKTMGALIGFTGEYINRLAAADKIPWHGIRNGVKVYRRFNPEEVRAALAHPAKPIRHEQAFRAKTG